MSCRSSRHPFFVVLSLPVFLAFGCAPAPDAPAMDEASQTEGMEASGAATMASAPFALISSAFVENAVIPLRYSGDGDNVSPPLEWTGAPAGTQSFALTLVDPDVPWGEEVPVYGTMPPPGTQPADLFIHWMAVNIPADVTSLADGASPGSMPAGVTELASSFALFGGPANQYGGPAPPPELKAHAYEFTLYALDVPELEGLTAESTYAELTEAMAGHVLATATLTGYFGH